MKTFHIVAALAASLSTLAASPAAAQAPAAERVVVSYADLDLASPAGVATLDRRILSAAQTACGPISNADLHGTNLAHECRGRTVREALSQTRGAIASARQGSATMLAGR